MSRLIRTGLALAFAYCLAVASGASAGLLDPSPAGMPTAVQLSASPTTVIYPAKVKITGRLLDSEGSPLEGEHVRIEARAASASTWSTATTLTTTAGGTYSWSAGLTATSQLRAAYDGRGLNAASTSAPVTVKVRPVIGFDQVWVIGQNQKTRLGGKVSPAPVGRQVRLDYLTGGKWKSTGKSTSVGRDGRWGIDVSFSTFGDRTFRAVLAEGKDSLGATSPQRTSRVTYAFSTVVSTGGRPRVDISRPTAPGGSCTIGLARIRAGSNQIVLHPGSQDPGGSWSRDDYIRPDERPGAVAAFNSGFLMKEARGGFYMDHRAPYALRNGAASLAMVSDGTWRLGEWGKDVGMSSRIVAVRQNAELMVSGSHVLSTVDSDIQQRWGFTFDSATNTWRSGVGVDPGGNLIYAMGPCLSPRQIAQALVNAGAVRAMELDVNVYWPAFDYYTASSPNSSSLTAHKLLSNEYNPADHYLKPQTRDFFSVNLR